MKKLAIFLAIMLIPFSAFALDTISDNDLNDVTGQAGVSIYTNSIQIVKTGVTTTYRDVDDGFNDGYGNSTNDFNIVSDATTTQIFFQGVDPLMIDVVDMETAYQILSNKYNLVASHRDFGDTAVMITLPNAIEIRNVGDSFKTYYAGGTDDRGNEMIKIGTTGGTTVISHADQTWKGADYGSIAEWEADSPWSNNGSMGTFGDHSDQVFILITAHSD